MQRRCTKAWAGTPQLSRASPKWAADPSPAQLAPDTLAARLRANDPPVIARIADDRVVLDARTIFPDELEAVTRAVRAALDA